MSESKLFEELFVVVCVWKFLMQGGVSPKSKLIEDEFSAYVWTFSSDATIRNSSPVLYILGPYGGLLVVSVNMPSNTRQFE